MHAPAITFEVANRFHSLRRRYLWARLVACIGFGCAGLLLGWMALALLDYFWELPLLVRRGLMIACGGLVAAAMLWEVVRSASDSRSGRFVGRLERQFDLLGQRLRTLLETVEGRWRAPEAMLSALGHQTLGRWETVQPTQVIPRQSVVAATLFAGLLAGIAVVAYFSGPEDWRTALLRAAGAEAAYTDLLVSPGDVRLLEGSAVSLQLELHGRTDCDCMLRYRNSDDTEWTEASLQPSPEATERSAIFVARLGKIDQSIDYQFVTSIGSTRTYTITMQPLIEVEDLSIRVAPPEYTRLPSRNFSSTNVSVLEGSQVSVTLKTNHPLAQVELQVGPTEKSLTKVDVAKGDDARIWTFALPADQAIRWHFAGRAEDGTPMKPVRGRTSVRRDQPPTVQWQEPWDELRVHMLAEVPMQLQVSDDYGVSEAGIVFQLGEDEFVLKRWPEEADEESPATDQAAIDVRATDKAATDKAAKDESATTRLRLSEVLPLESLALSEKDFIAYYAFARDNRPGATQPVESEVRYIDIRPLKQFYSERDAEPSMGRGSDVLGLDDIIRRQRFLINRTRTFSRSPASTGPDRIGAIERMVEGQSELADLTRFLTEFLISKGNDNTESLSQAEAAMLQAADSLASGNFDTALVQEQNALQYLAEARQALEIILSRKINRQQQQEFSRFRREMQQRLRRNVQTDDKLADSLQQIAEEQKQLAMDAEKLAQAPTAAPPKADSANAPAAEASSNPDASEEAATGGDAASEQADPGEQLQARQQELLDRLSEIDSALSDDVKRSELATERMQQAVSAMDELVSEAEQKNWSGLSTGGEKLSAQLRETADHIGALAEREPAQRIATIRDMTSSLANMEAELSEMELSAMSAAKQPSERDDAKDGAAQDAAAKDEAANGGAAKDVPAIDRLRAKADRLADRVQQRAATLTDVLAQPIAANDLAGVEVNDQLLQLAQQQNLADKLAESRAAAEEPSDQRETAAWSDAAMDRATEYADVAAQLEGLYRQLVMPRMENLRRLESKASALVQLLDQQLKEQSQEGNGGGQSSEKPLDAKSAGMLEEELERDLAAAGLEELADELAGGEETEDEESKPMNETGGRMAAGARASRFALNSLRAFRGRVIRVDRKLQEILRDLILSEISADGNTPVPPEYKDLVDRYFRSISGGAAAAEVTK